MENGFVDTENPNYGVIDRQQHGCCIPGSCENEDAIKVVSASLCYRVFIDYYTTANISSNSNINNIDDQYLDHIYCHLENRDLDIGFWLVVSLFIFFFVMVIITTCYRHCYNR